MRVHLSLALCALTVLLGGCMAAEGETRQRSEAQTSQPEISSTPSVTPSAPEASTQGEDRDLPEAAQRGEAPETPETEDTVPTHALAPTEESAIERFARLYVNWTWKTVHRHQLMLAENSIGEARIAAQQAAAQVSSRSALGQNAVSNSGQVISIAQGKGGADGYWVVVTDERTRGKNQYRELPSTMHVSYAQVTEVQGGWVVSRWEPQN